MNNTSKLLSHLRFHFSLKHPNLEECYTDGYTAALAGLYEEENPYPEDSREFELWFEGWWAGFYGEAPLFDVEHAGLSETEPSAANDQVYQSIQRLLNNHFFTECP